MRGDGNMKQVWRTVCLKDCPDACALLVTTDRGSVVNIAGDPEHPTTRGYICDKTRLQLEWLHSPDRIHHPLVRTGPKGSGQFRRATWDEAIAVIARRWREIIAAQGAEAILPYSYMGSEGLINARGLDRRFFHALGASKLERTICAAAGVFAYRQTVGIAGGIDPEHHERTRLLILWGLNVVASNIHQVPFIQAARRQGCRVVLIDPVPEGNAALADWIITPRPGTDATLALGLMNVIIREGLHDQTYVERYTHGFSALAERVAEYPPERVAAITGVEAATIVALARMYARTHPSLIRAGVGVTHHVDGDAAIRNMACLTGLTGAWQYPGGGMTFANYGWFPINYEALERPDLAPAGVRTINMSQLGQALLAAQSPVMSLYVYCSNPAVVAPDQRQVLAGLQREDLFVVVHDQVLTDTCRFADVILPACSQFEYEDLAISPWHLYLQHNARIIEPVGEARPNTEVFRLLASAMALQEPCLYDSDEELMRAALDHPQARAQGITLDALRVRGWMRVRSSTEALWPFRSGFPTPSGRLQFYSPDLAAMGLDPLPFSRPPLEASYPLHLVSRSARYFINTTYANLPTHQRRARGRPALLMHPVDAAARQIRDGDQVRIRNQCGECQLHVVITERIRPGVVASDGRWWLRSMPGGAGLNALTEQSVSCLGRGPTFNGMRVEVELANSPAPSQPPQPVDGNRR